MERQHKDIMISLYLEKSNKAVEEARFNFNNEFLNIAESRTYYAIFYAVTALGYLEEFITSHHSQLMGWFNKKFIKEDKIFGPGLFKIYKLTYENRRKSDYEVTYKPNAELISSNLDRAVSFIEQVEAYIQDKLRQ